MGRPSNPLIAACVLSALALAASRSDAAIDLAMRADLDAIAVGESVAVGLYAVSDNDEENQLFAAAEIIFTWDPAVLTLVATSSAGAIPLLYNGLPLSGDYGLNESLPPADGDGLVVCLGNLGTRAVATPDGALLHTFTFEAIAPSAATVIGIAATGGSGGETVVFDGTIPGLTVTGALIDDVVAVGTPCDADLDGDGNVGFSDLVILLATWGGCPGCPADLDGDGDVGFSDLVSLLAAWGPCPRG